MSKNCRYGIANMQSIGIKKLIEDCLMDAFKNRLAFYRKWIFKNSKKLQYFSRQTFHGVRRAFAVRNTGVFTSD